jgi:hypothetical protein
MSNAPTGYPPVITRIQPLPLELRGALSVFYLLNKYFQNQEQTKKSSSIKTFKIPIKKLKILTPLVFQPRPLFKKIPRKLERLWKNKPWCLWWNLGAVRRYLEADNDNTESKLTLKQWFACEYHKMGLEGIVFGRVGFFWGLNAKVSITVLRVWGWGFDTPQELNVQ